MNIPILFHQNGLIACEKPVGICAQDTPAGDGLPQLLSQQLRRRVLPLHRLDQGVGGVMLLCDRPQRAAEYTAYLQNGILRKRYLAVVCGALPQAQGTLTDLLFHDARQNRTYVVDRLRKGVKEAVLDYTVLAEAQDGHTLLCITLHTGRTHQIRAQFASRKLPLCGDGKYGSREKGALALWSYALDSTDPAVLDFSVSAPPPKCSPWLGFDPISPLLP